MNSNSHISEFNSDSVVKSCTWHLAKREERICEERHQMIEKLLSKKKRWWNFFSSKVETTEDAILYLKNNGDMFCSLWDEPERKGSMWADICYDLLEVLTANESKTIYLCDSTASFIANIINEMKEEPK